MVERFNVHLDRIAYIDNLARVLNASPRELGNMNHTVDTAQINKSPVRGQALYHTGVFLANLGGFPELISQCFALILQNRTDGTNRTAAAAVDLNDAEADFLLKQIIQRV